MAKATPTVFMARSAPGEHDASIFNLLKDVNHTRETLSILDLIVLREGATELLYDIHAWEEDKGHRFNKNWIGKVREWFTAIGPAGILVSRSCAEAKSHDVNDYNMAELASKHQYELIDVTTRVGELRMNGYVLAGPY